MGETLKEKTISALFWNFVDKFGQQILYAITGIILARILNQDDYGLIGMLAIFIVISNLFIDSGFGASLIRKKDVQDIDFSTVFIFNTLIAISIYLLLYFSAPFIAKFYNQDKLVSLSRVIFLSLPINALGVVQSIILTKHIQFQILAKINLIALLLSGIISIVMACTGFGVWALVFQTLSYALLRTILLWLWGVWKISFLFDKHVLLQILPFSSNILFTNLLTLVSNNIYTATIAKFYPLNQAGSYTQANKFSDVPTTLLSNVTHGTMFPILSSISNDDKRIKRACRKTVRTLSFLLFPLIFGLVCMAKPLVIIMLTTKWEAIIPYFQLLCIAGIFSPLSNINNSFLHAKGLANITLILEAIKLIIIIIAISITIKTGIINMLIGLIIAKALNHVINAIWASRYTKYTLWEQLKDMFPYIAISLVMAILMYSVTFFISNLYILLLLQMAIGGSFYIITNKFLGSKIYEDAIQLLKNKLQ